MFVSLGSFVSGRVLALAKGHMHQSRNEIIVSGSGVTTKSDPEIGEAGAMHGDAVECAIQEKNSNSSEMKTEQQERYLLASISVDDRKTNREHLSYQKSQILPFFVAVFSFPIVTIIFVISFMETQHIGVAWIILFTFPGEHVSMLTLCCLNRYSGVFTCSNFTQERLPKSLDIILTTKSILLFYAH